MPKIFAVALVPCQVRIFSDGQVFQGSDIRKSGAFHFLGRCFHCLRLFFYNFGANS